ncbi:DUF2690 domain-containing protein [Nonomuraea purpurea]|uniref:DUF2690 domain-containing protein n=1 Tax=Nonomuraea purpurea TaxID=1849276 RepID=A0ABV8GES1_9ACTN
MKLRAVATAIGVAASVVLIAGSPAHAQAGPKQRYDHKDPYKAGCASTSRVVETAKLKSPMREEWGTVSLMWSRKCQTNWIKVKTSAKVTGTINLYTQDRRSDSFSFKKGNRGVHWGDMLWANDMCAWGSVTVQQNGGRGGQYATGSTGMDAACN